MKFKFQQCSLIWYCLMLFSCYTDRTDFGQQSQNYVLSGSSQERSANPSMTDYMPFIILEFHLVILPLSFHIEHKVLIIIYCLRDNILHTPQKCASCWKFPQYNHLATHKRKARMKCQQTPEELPIKTRTKSHYSPYKAKLKRLTTQSVVFKLPYLRIETVCELEQALLLKFPTAKQQGETNVIM